MTSLQRSSIPNIFVLDGGFSSQLTCHVGNNVDGDPLWSSRFLQTHPQEVINTHIDFLRAGADIIMTNTYQASIGGFSKYLGLRPEEGYSLIKRSVELAKQARDMYLNECEKTPPERTPLIAGSVGPYGAHLHDGSEYNGKYANNTSVETMYEWHKPRIEALIEAGVDLLAFETLPCVKEAEVLIDMLKKYSNMKAWLSFNCKDENNIANGENFPSAVKKCWDANPEQLLAVGVNCCSPLIVYKLLENINNDRKEAPIPFVVYPNSGEKYNAQIGWIEGDKCEGLESFVHDWLNIGVQYVGGCCRTYGPDITKIRAQVQSWCEKKKFESIFKD